MLYKLHVEYRELAVLRLRLLKEAQINGGTVPIEDFKKLIKCIIKESTESLEKCLIEAVRADDKSVSYCKLSSLINKFQYNPFWIK